MLFDNLDDYTSETDRQDEARAMQKAFGTRPPRPLRPAQQDNLFNPNPQGRITFPVEDTDTLRNE